ncbi:MAG: hypothetical protein NXI27_05725 [Alphaproteobacteria bacterium]|nr:hypothetical protein [Alphaproteobacteria bacterium]
MDNAREAATKPARVRALLTHPALWLVICIGALVFLARGIVNLPIGPMYWDTFVYFDAVHRINLGQIPIVDFSAPVGPLGYYAMWIMTRLFPDGQPLLLAQWSMLLITAPLMLILASDVAGRSRFTALALTIPFLIFAVLPFNVIAYFSYPGVDGFGIYNRHAAQLLYLTAATVFFIPGSNKKILLLSVLVLALFLSKITAFLSGGLLLAFALLAGRIMLREALLTALICAAIVAALQLVSGMTLAYVNDILLLATANSGALLPRFMTAASQHLGVLGAGGAVMVFLILDDLMPRSDARWTANAPKYLIYRMFDRDWLWIGTLLFAGLFFETQNTGSHGFTLLWPGLLFVWLRRQPLPEPRRTILLVLIALVCIPSLMSVLHKTGRTLGVAPTYDAIENNNLRTLGNVTTKPIFMQRAAETEQWYGDNADAIADLAERGELISFVLYSVPSYQVLWLRIHDQLVDAVRAYEAQNNVRFSSILTLDFTNILPYLMGRNAPKHVAIGADPSRTVGALDADAIAAVEETDLVVHRKCPVTTGTQELYAIYKPALSGRRKIELTPCFDAYIK